MHLNENVKLTYMSLLEEVRIQRVENARYIVPFLSECPRLTSLHISGLGCDCELFANVLPSLEHLQYIQYKGSVFVLGYPCCSNVVRSLSKLKQLQHIVLDEIELDDDDALQVTSNMAQLKTVELYRVHLPDRGWKQFVESLLSVQNQVSVTLSDTNFDGSTLAFLQTSEFYDVRTGNDSNIHFFTVP